MQLASGVVHVAQLHHLNIHDDDDDDDDNDYGDDDADDDDANANNDYGNDADVHVAQLHHLSAVITFQKNSPMMMNGDHRNIILMMMIVIVRGSHLYFVLHLLRDVFARRTPRKVFWQF